MRYRLTVAADADIEQILKTTARLSGAAQVKVYARIIALGIEKIAENPRSAPSVDAAYIREGVRLYHMEHAAGPRRGAAHTLFYELTKAEQGEFVVLRVLHERVQPKRRLIQSLREEETEELGPRSR